MLFQGVAMLVFVMVLLRLFVAFWAAEIMEEKKLLADGVVGPFSGVGVSGASVMLDSLLGPKGPKVPEPDLPLLCEIIVLLVLLGEVDDAWVGAGTVTTISGDAAPGLVVDFELG